MENPPNFDHGNAAKIARKNPRIGKLVWQVTVKGKNVLGVEQNSYVVSYIKISMVHMQRKICTSTKVTV